MNRTMQSHPVLYWAPRLLGLAAAGFLALFALDVFEAGYGFWGTLQALAIHLVPAIGVLVALAIAWRWELPGGLLFILAGFGYAFSIDAAAHPDWVVVIAGPLWLVGALFLLSRAFPGRPPGITASRYPPSREPDARG